MRNLTIKRTKSFVGCLAKMKIYIEDPTSNEIIINNIPCRKIGVIKNGEEKTFQIAEQPAKAFVIADRISKNYCNEFYELPEGYDDIFLSGKNEFNPANGNAFRFDNNESEATLENRKRGTRKGLLLLVALIIIGAIVGFLISSVLFSGAAPQAKTFSSDGMSITLTDEFRETDIGNYTVAYDSRYIAVFALKEEFSAFDGFENYTLEDYGYLVLENNGLDIYQLKNENGLTYFKYEFTNPETNDTYQYFSYIYKADDSFWLIQFAVLDEVAEEYAPQISDWAKSVKFSGESSI